MGSGVRRIVLLTLGWEELPKSISWHGAPDTERLREPVPGVLLEVDGGWLMLDTGFNTSLIRDPWLARRYHGREGYHAVLPPGDGEPVEAALAAHGIDLDDVHAVAVSHLHVDHGGGLKLFAGRVPVHAQRRELEFGLGPRAEENAVLRCDFDDPRIDWRLADGDVEIAPGVTAIATYGHTPGHQSFMVELDESVGGGGFVFAFDAADLAENIEHEHPVGAFVDTTPEEVAAQIRKLKALAASRGFRIVPGHDPNVWPALTEELAARFA